MSIGYPDYTRLQTTGGYELASVAGPITDAQVIFQGFVGSWPYLNIYTPAALSADEYQLIIGFFADSTQHTPVGTVLATRYTSAYALAQYAVLGPWVNIQVVTASGSALDIGVIGVYGTYGNAGAARLHGGPYPILNYNATLAASTGTTQQAGYIMPGPAKINIWTAAASWYVYLGAYDYSAGNYPAVWRIDNTIAAHGGTFDLPMLDTPHLLTVHNGDTSARQFIINWIQAGY